MFVEFVSDSCWVDCSSLACGVDSSGDGGLGDSGSMTIFDDTNYITNMRKSGGLRTKNHQFVRLIQRKKEKHVGET